MSDEIPDINEAVRGSFNIIESDIIDELIPYEQRHADIQCLKINDIFFVLKEAVNLQNKLRSLGFKVITTDENIGGKYPENVLLNAVYLNNRMYCRTDALSENTANYCRNNGIELINVNQGYTKCSTAVIDNYFITADKGIFDAMTANGAEGLLIDSGGISLNGVDYGFIGGSCFYDDGTAFFTGDITKHKSYYEIREFLYNRNIKIVSLTFNKIYDIGGFIVI